MKMLEAPVQQKAIPSEKEMGILGLPTVEDIEKRVETINSNLTISYKEYRTNTLNFSQSKENVAFTNEQYKQYGQEFLEDLADFKLRVQRLKTRVLRQYLSGSIKNPENANLSYAENENTFEGKIVERVGNLSKKEGLTEEDIKQLIETINKALPTDLRLQFLDNLSGYDASEIWELAMKLAFGEALSDPQQREIVESMITAIQEMESQMVNIESQGELFSHPSQSFINESKYRDLWVKYRQLLKQIASSEELDSWFSPSYGQSGKGQSGKDQRSQRARADYQRFAMPEFRSLEREFLESHFGQRQYNEYFNSLLFGGGLAALEGIMGSLDLEIRSRFEGRSPREVPKIFKTKIYFEVDSAIDGHFKEGSAEVIDVETSDVKKLAQRIKVERPLAVFLAPVENEFDMRVTEIKKLLELLKKPEGWALKPNEALWGYPHKRTYIIVDDSAMSRLANWRKLDFGNMPNCLKIISFESLVKYGQDGQDLVQAGLVTTIGQYGDEWLNHVRSRNGLMPPENTFRKLYSTVSGDLADKKMVRHSRNAQIIAQEMDKISRQRGSFIKRVVYTGLPSHPDYKKARSELMEGGGIINLDFDPEFLFEYREAWEGYGHKIDKIEVSKRSNDIAAAFNHLVLKLAEDMGLELNEGTSYGFNNTRVSVYQRWEDFKEGLEVVSYVRLATGTENIKDTYLLTRILKRADAIFAEARKNRQLLELTRALLSPGFKLTFS